MFKTRSKKSLDPINRLSCPTNGYYLTCQVRKLLQTALQSDLPDLYRQRIQIMLLADDGYTQTQICKELGCSQVTARYWISIAKSGKADTWKECSVGRPKIVNQEYLSLLKQLVANSPRDYGYSCERWTLQWLSDYLCCEFGIKISTKYLSTLLKTLGLSIKKKSGNS